MTRAIILAPDADLTVPHTSSVFPFCYPPHVFQHLKALLQHERGGTLTWSPIEVRQRQALLLSIAAAAVFIDDTHRFVLRNEDGSSVEVTVYSREWACKASQLAYALVQPRQGVKFQEEEMTIDLALMGRTWLLSSGCHPRLEGLVVILSKIVVGDAAFHMAMINKYGWKIPEMEQWKRIINDAFMAQNHHKLWKDINHELSIAPIVTMCGPLQVITGETLDEDVYGASSKLCLWFFFQDTKFQFILDKLCNSSLCNQNRFVDPVQLAAQQEADAEQLFDEIKQWNEETFAPPPEFQSQGMLRNPQEKLACRYMIFSARAKLTAALDLIMCTLENDQLGLQELHSSANPMQSQPSEVDKVAEWIGSLSFYRTEKAFMQKPEDRTSMSPVGPI